jgi:hypothetical protein
MQSIENYGIKITVNYFLNDVVIYTVDFDDVKTNQPIPLILWSALKHRSTVDVETFLNVSLLTG